MHLVLQCDPDVLLQYEPGHYDDLVLEAAQIALNSGFTTVFDTWGPLESLRRVRDRIREACAVGSRIFLAGNITGNGGPWSPDFFSYEDKINSAVAQRVNGHWTQGVGEELAWMPASDVRKAVRNYVAESGIDFLKYAGSSHKDLKYLTFSPAAQRAIVEEAHAAGMTVQACTCTSEALEVGIEAGVDLLQHGTNTGRYPMPPETVRKIVDRQIPCVAFLTTDRFLAAIQANPGSRLGDLFNAKDENERALIDAGARLLLGTDGGVYSPAGQQSPICGYYLAVPDWYGVLGRSHQFWFRAAEQRHMKPMDILMSATRNVAEAYGKGDEVGSIKVGRKADLLVLDDDPLASAENFSSISRIIKDGIEVDRTGLPERPVLTREQ